MTARKPPWELFEERSLQRKKVGEVPAKISDGALQQLLIRLLCRTLTIDEVVAASLHPARSPSPFFRASSSKAQDGRIRVEVGSGTAVTYVAERHIK
jgi:hypothetical protein